MENKKSLYSQLHLPLNTQSAIRHTRLNGVPLHEETKNNRVFQEGPYVNGLLFNKKDNSVVLESWKIEKGLHTLSCFCTVDEYGKLVEGYICCAMGWIEMDQEYLDIFLSECKNTNRAWDKISFYSESGKLEVIKF
jgi:hypothetical protein